MKNDNPTVVRLFLIFGRIGLTSFGGGLSGWLLREFVQERKWLTEDEFFSGLSLSQALPGINVKNMAIWIGYRLLGFRGAVAGLFGIIVPPAVVLILLGALFASITHYPATQMGLNGAAAAAIGLSLSMGITAARGVPRKFAPLTIMAAIFVAVGVLHWPMVWTVLLAGTISVVLAYRDLSGQAK